METLTESVLILAPEGRDASVADRILADANLASTACGDLNTLVESLARAPCAIATEESLNPGDRSALGAWLSQQPAWSDFPFILLTARGTPPDTELVDSLGNVTLLERPFQPATLVTAVRSAIRARRRQHDAAQFLAERRETAERQSLLIRELHHRVKNTLATVQALLGASARSATSVEAFYSAFADRVVSLAKTHDLLTEDYWQTASLHGMLSNELGPYNDAGGDRIRLDGPAVELTADLAVPTGMAIHELTTNAAKHGALSLPRGRIEVAWSVTGGTTGAGGGRLCLDWTECDGPPTSTPTRRGFGSTLLQRVLTNQCSAEIAFDFRPSGLHFRMEAPLVSRRLVPSY